MTAAAETYEHPVARLMYHVITGTGTLIDVHRLATSDRDGRRYARPTEDGRAVLRALKNTARRQGLPHVLDLLHRYGRWEAKLRARRG
ncbi:MULTISPECIES: hypothetical protein [Streptomyces]|uniref:hypothetical protein n=1 Tax=Streptomyces TaxID=1883 RepID=UPI0004CB2A85|nr:MULTISPECIES: hypothetical protein [Streptomyces]